MNQPVADAGRRLDKWIPRAALFVLPAVWVFLAATLPVSSDRQLTIDVFCTSGNPVVGVWIESGSGASWFAEQGEAGSASVQRYIFHQKFSGPYQARVGCGGSQQQWGLTIWSSFSDSVYRRLACNDTNASAARDSGCLDQSA